MTRIKIERRFLHPDIHGEYFHVGVLEWLPRRLVLDCESRCWGQDGSYETLRLGRKTYQRGQPKLSVLKPSTICIVRQVIGGLEVTIVGLTRPPPARSISGISIGRDNVLVYALPIASDDQKCGWVLMAVACRCLATATVEIPAASGPQASHTTATLSS
jgi:hypothetical protein